MNAVISKIIQAAVLGLGMQILKIPARTLSPSNAQKKGWQKFFLVDILAMVDLNINNNNTNINNINNTTISMS